MAQDTYIATVGVKGLTFSYQKNAMRFVFYLISVFVIVS